MINDYITSRDRLQHRNVDYTPVIEEMVEDQKYRLSLVSNSISELSSLQRNLERQLNDTLELLYNSK